MTVLVPGAIGLLALSVLILLGLAAARDRVPARRHVIAVGVMVAAVLTVVTVLPEGKPHPSHSALTYSSEDAPPLLGVPSLFVSDPAVLDLPVPESEPAVDPTTSTTAVADPSALAATTGATVPPASTKTTTKAKARKPAPAAATTTTAAPPPPPAVNDPHTVRLRHALEAWMNGQSDASSAAVAVSIAGGDGPVWAAEAMRKGAEAPARAGDAYGALSITKTFVEALVLRQVVAGTIDLDAPVPELPGVDPLPEGTVITPRMLLQHTSGLVDYLRANGYDPNQPIKPADCVNLALHTPLMFEPGTKAVYSRTNFHWLGLLLEHVTGATFADQIAGLAREFGLPHTTLDPAARPGWVGYASGGVRSTVGDLARWGAVLFTPGRVLPADQLDLLTTIGNVGASLGMWPLCPCHADADGTKRYEAIGQVVANGGFLYFPADRMVIVVRVDPETMNSGGQTASVASVIRTAVNTP